MASFHPIVQKLKEEFQNTRDCIKYGERSTEPPSALSSEPVKVNTVNKLISSTQRRVDTMEEPFDPLSSAMLEQCRQEVAKTQAEIEASANLRLQT